jgi:hypothetical protein
MFEKYAMNQFGASRNNNNTKNNKIQPMEIYIHFSTEQHMKR